MQKIRKPSRTSEDDVKIELWKSLPISLKPQDNVNTKSESFERATLFGKVVADSLLQYNPKECCYLKKKVLDVFYDYEQHKSNRHSTYPNNPSYLANQFIQENNFRPTHFSNMASNVRNNGMPMNQSSHKKTSISQNNEVDPFSPLSMCSNDSYWYFKHTIEEKHCCEFLYCIITVLYQSDSFSQRVGLVDIKGHYFLMLFFLWKI